MKELNIDRVTGSECLGYINRFIGFAHHGYSQVNTPINSIVADSLTCIRKVVNRNEIAVAQNIRNTTLQRWNHDTTKRKIGLVLGRSEEGGYEVALLGDEYIGNGGNINTVGNCDYTSIRTACGLLMPYEQDGNNWREKYVKSLYPTCVQIENTNGSEGVPAYYVWTNAETSGSRFLTFDESLEVIPTFSQFSGRQRFSDVWRYADAVTTATSYELTTDKAQTMVFGHKSNLVISYPLDYINQPLNIFSGNLYEWAMDFAFRFEPKIPPTIQDILFNYFYAEFENADFELTNIGCNLTSVPYNIILTYDEQQAQKYLRDGTLPSDAFLFPLDFDNLPTYQSDDSSDEDDDDGQGDLDDDSRDCDSDLPEVPSYTPNSLNTNNVYLLTAGEVNQIINWIWNDVGSVQDLDDLVTKIQGLTSDLIQNFLMFRVMPVKPAWIGGAGNSTNFVVGSVEKAGEYMNLAKGNAPIVNIGSYNFGNKFNTFKFLNYSPYSDFKLYLPYHGIVDIDVSVFQGHSLDVKAVYDYMTGTITYMIYCDNTWLVNTYTAKMAVDLSVSLQTKNDRDSTIFGNVSNAVAGVMSAGASVASGNPIGLVMGAQAIAQQTHSAPFKAMGQVGEMGAFYTPQRCKVLIRRPVPTTPDTYNQNVGRQAYYSTTLAKLKGKGYTKCINPRLKFTKTIPLADEEEQINQLLSEGVYL